MGEHRRAKQIEKPWFARTHDFPKLGRTYLFVGAWLSVGNAGFPGALIDGRSTVTTYFDYLSLVTLLLCVIAALSTWLSDGANARYLAVVTALLTIGVGLAGLWLHFAQGGLPAYPGRMREGIFSCVSVILGLLSFNSTRQLIPHRKLETQRS